MTDDSGQEAKEQDPVVAIRTALNKALGFLKQLLSQEEKELKEEIDEVQGTMQRPVGEGGAPTGQVPSQQPKTQPPAGSADTSDQSSTAE